MRKKFIKLEDGSDAYASNYRAKVVHTLNNKIKVTIHASNINRFSMEIFFSA